MTPLDTALELVRVGYYLAPVTLTIGPDGRKVADYHGLSWPKVSTINPAVILEWSDTYPGCSFLVDTGKSGIVAVDLDVKIEDGILAWTLLGGPAGGVVVDTPSGGEHHYFAANPDRPLRNTTDPGSGIDTRAVGGHVFAPGACFADGCDGEYVARGPIYTPGDLPPVPELLYREREAKPASTNAALPLENRVFTRDQASEYVKREAVAPMREAVEGNRNNSLNIASVVYGHFVGPFCEYEDAVLALRKLAEKVGLRGTEVEKTIASGLNHGMTQPYTLREVDLTDTDTLDGAGELTAEIDRRERALRVDAAARERIAAGTRRPLARLSAAEFLARPQPTYLVPGMLYRDSLAVVFGGPGAGKTFLALDVALHLATGRLWRGEVLMPRTRVHYVMAEGEAVNVGRTAAWLVHHGVDPGELEGWFDPFVEPITLTPAGIAEYRLLAATEQPGLIVIDTKHASMEGDESKPADLKIMRDALNLLRIESGGACVLLVDHSGLGDQTRTRGSNAQKAMVATEIMVSIDGGIRVAQDTRNTAGSTAHEWPFRLQQVPDAPHPAGTDVPVVAVAADRAGEISLRDDEWQVPRTDLPAVVAELSGAAGEAACDIFRALVVAQDRDGMTVSQIKTLIGDGPRKHSRTKVYAAVSQLANVGVLEGGPSGKTWLLNHEYMSWSAP